MTHGRRWPGGSPWRFEFAGASRIAISSPWCRSLQRAAHVLVQHAADSAFDRNAFLHGTGAEGLEVTAEDGLLIRWSFWPVVFRCFLS